ncbi:MAG: TetR/AcrR family transcriptional regulator [Campylobacterota bacterium]|nr:TetR/AcrR family transcriptional regulator [Campylobacterota bacterium]
MPKIVDKVQKRKDIAKSTCSLFIEKGFVNISISQIAKVAGIGKGTIYEYFKNKEDIIFELMSCLQEKYDPKLEKNLDSCDDVVTQVKYLFDIYFSDDIKVQAQRKIYKEFLAIYLNNPSEEIINYHITLKQKYYLVLEDILTKAINNNQLKKESLYFIPSIFATIEGFFIVNASTDEIMQYIDNLFLLLEINKGEVL